MDTTPNRNDVTVLPSKGPTSPTGRLGWVVYEYESEDELIRQKEQSMSPEDFKAWMHSKDPIACGSDIDLSEKYIGAYSTKYDPDNKRTSYTQIQVLPELTGLPWNNHALNWVHGLRPSAISVILHHGEIACECKPWKVLVFLDECRYIKKITQTAEVALMGADNGHDLHCQLQHWQKYGCVLNYKQHRGPFSIINDAAVSRILVK